MIVQKNFGYFDFHNSIFFSKFLDSRGSCVQVRSRNFYSRSDQTQTRTQKICSGRVWGGGVWSIFDHQFHTNDIFLLLATEKGER